MVLASAGHGQGDHFPLHGSGRRVAHRLHRSQERSAEVQLGEQLRMGQAVGHIGAPFQYLIEVRRLCRSVHSDGVGVRVRCCNGGGRGCSAGLGTALLSDFILLLDDALQSALLVWLVIKLNLLCQ